MQPAPPPQPLQQPAPQGWSRFWLGVLAGGCGLVILEVLAAAVAGLVIGATVNSAVRATGALPGGITLPSGRAGLSAQSEPCNPQPCMARGGVTVLVANVNRNAGRAADGRAHLVQMDVTFVDTSGSHTVTPEEIAMRDSTGTMLLPGMDSAAAQCGGATSQDLQAGQRAGPYPLCYAVAGAPTADLTLVWINPEDLSIVELKLP